eukprot:9332923-Alexandrium_andersonii.AAC.1
MTRASFAKGRAISALHMCRIRDGRPSGPVVLSTRRARSTAAASRERTTRKSSSPAKRGGRA